MALMKCAECGGQVSDKASNCPHCGCPVARPVMFKCPECGGRIADRTKPCPHCGHPPVTAARQTGPKPQTGGASAQSKPQPQAAQSAQSQQAKPKLQPVKPQPEQTAQPQQSRKIKRDRMVGCGFLIVLLLFILAALYGFFKWDIAGKIMSMPGPAMIMEKIHFAALHAGLFFAVYLLLLIGLGFLCFFLEGVTETFSHGDWALTGCGCGFLFVVLALGVVWVLPAIIAGWKAGTTAVLALLTSPLFWVVAVIIILLFIIVFMGC